MLRKLLPRKEMIKRFCSCPTFITTKMRQDLLVTIGKGAKWRTILESSERIGEV